MKSSRILLILGAIILIALGGWAMFTPKSDSTDLLATPIVGDFEVVVTTTGELKAKRSTKIMAPRKARSVGIHQVKINDLVPEGTVVDSGAYVADLDKSEVLRKIQEEQINVEAAMSEFNTSKLDTALTLSKTRNEIVNLRFDVEERKAEMEQSKFEAPATQQKVRLMLEKAERSYEQAKDNYAKQVAQSVANVYTKQLKLNKAQNRLTEYTDLLAGFSIRAPSAGMVIYDRDWDGRKVATNSTIHMWNPVVATLPDLTEMESITYVNEIDIQKVKEGQEVTIGLDAVAGKFLTGIVKQVANIGEQRPNSDSKVFEVVITVQEKDTTLRPAMTTSNEIKVAAVAKVIHIPLECLHTQDSVSFVFKQNGVSVVKQEVKTGLINENDAEITEGVGIDDKLFLSMPIDTVGLQWSKL